VRAGPAAAWVGVAAAMAGESIAWFPTAYLASPWGSRVRRSSCQWHVSCCSLRCCGIEVGASGAGAKDGSEFERRPLDERLGGHFARTAATVHSMHNLDARRQKQQWRRPKGLISVDAT